MNHDEWAVPDRQMSPNQLREKYCDDFDGGEHPAHTWWDWYQQVAQRSTRRGYWDWVAAQLEEEE